MRRFMMNDSGESVTVAPVFANLETRPGRRGRIVRIMGNFTFRGGRGIRS